MEIKQQQFLGASEKRQVLDIYHDSFPESERVAFHILEEKINSQESFLFTAYSDMQVVGFGVVNPLSCRSACLLEYMAIKNDKRSLGIGSKLLSHIITALSSEDDISCILLEVEPIEGAPPNELSIRKKRIAFYQRFGAMRLDNVPKYWVPDLSGSGYIPMVLMWLPLTPQKPELSSKQLKECVASIYIDSYSADPNEKQLRSVLDGIK